MMLGSCEVCGANFGLQQHHIVKRSQGGGDDDQNLVWLCWDCHHGTLGVHGKHGRQLDLELKLKLQEEYLEKYPEEKARKLMGGKLYLKEE